MQAPFFGVSTMEAAYDLVGRNGLRIVWAQLICGRH